MKYTKLFPLTINGIQYTDEEVQNSEELQLKASGQGFYVIQHIKNPSEEVKMEAVKQNGHAIEYIENPSKKVLDYLYKNNRKILELYYKIED